MIKSLIALTIALGSIGLAAPANAGTCWYRHPGQYVEGTYCPVTERRNYNGHIVYDIVDGDGNKFTVVLWNDNTAEVLNLKGNPRQVVYSYTDKDGDERLVWPSGFEFIFSKGAKYGS